MSHEEETKETTEQEEKQGDTTTTVKRERKVSESLTSSSKLINCAHCDKELSQDKPDHVVGMIDYNLLVGDGCDGHVIFKVCSKCFIDSRNTLFPFESSNNTMYEPKPS